MSRLLRALPWLVISLWVAWLVGVILHGAGYSIWNSQHLDFSRSGAFGDSFGSLASLMAALAAAGALLTLQQQRAQNAIQSFDSNFFGLLGHFQDIVESTDAHNFITDFDNDGNEVVRLNYVYEGRDAFKAILGELRERLHTRTFSNAQTVRNRYEQFYGDWQDDLGHYFRLLYHLFRLIDDKCTSDKMYYARIVRAHLSNSEIFLVGYNCLCGEGRSKFMRYLEKFAILHNIAYSDTPFGRRERQFFEGNFSASVFGNSGDDPRSAESA